MLPLTGPPALRLPPTAGAPGNVVAIVVLLASPPTSAPGAGRRAALAAGAALPVLGLAASLAAPSTSSPSPRREGPAALAARIVAAAVLVLARQPGSPAAARPRWWRRHWRWLARRWWCRPPLRAAPAGRCAASPVSGAVAVEQHPGARLMDRWPRRLLTAAGPPPVSPGRCWLCCRPRVTLEGSRRCYDEYGSPVPNARWGHRGRVFVNPNCNRTWGADGSNRPRLIEPPAS